MSNLFTIIAIEFIFLSVQFLRGVADVPTIYLIVLIAIYFMIFICNILFMIRQIKRGKFANKKKRMGASLGFSIIGYVIGMVLIRIIEMNFSYNTTIFIGSGVVLLGAYLFAFGSHFYLCFYLLKKKNHTEKTME
jgi:ABC-type dipeptide/oligopeptide/nickel transport system permease component